MKSNLLLAICLLLSVISQAQPIINATTFNPNVGDVYIYQSDTNPFSVGSSGANQSWTITTSGSNYDTLSFVNKTSGFNNSLFVPSNLASNSGLSATLPITYISETSTAFQINGGVFDSSSTLIYTNLKDFIRFPFTFNSNYVDTYSGTLSIVSPFNYNASLYGIDSVFADGYGTLTTGFGTYSNVLRVKTITTQYDTIDVFGTLVPSQSRNTNYVWYSPSTNFYIASVSINDNGTYNTSVLSSNPITNIFKKSNSNNIQIFPNPATTEIKLTNNVNDYFKIIDITGKIVYEEKLNKQNQLINTSELNAGNYQVIISNNESVKSTKLQILKL